MIFLSPSVRAHSYSLRTSEDPGEHPKDRSESEGSTRGSRDPKGTMTDLAAISSRRTDWY